MIKNQNGTGQDIWLKMACWVVSCLAPFIADKDKLEIIDTRNHWPGAVLKPQLTKNVHFWPELVQHAQQSYTCALGPGVKVGAVKIEGESACHHLLPVEVVVAQVQKIRHLCTTLVE